MAQLKNGNLQYVSDAGVAGKVERIVGDGVFSDGQWHTLVLQRNVSSTTVLIDESILRVITRTTQDFGGLDVLTLSLGGEPPRTNSHKAMPGKPTLYYVFFFKSFIEELSYTFLSVASLFKKTYEPSSVSNLACYKLACWHIQQLVQRNVHNLILVQNKKGFLITDTITTLYQ